ncbi:uncharacterized protein LOC144152557 [Haemaphysalis longicornis]
MKWHLFVLIFAGVLKQAFGHSTEPAKQSRDVPDSFKVMEIFKSIVSITSRKHGTPFECLRAYQTSINPDTRRSEYVWMLQAPGDPTAQEVHFHELAGDGGKVFLTVEDDPEIITGTILYTDNEYCFIEDVDFEGYDCILWSQTEVKDSAPQHCIDKFVELCGVEVSAHSRDLCPDGEGDY